MAFVTTAEVCDANQELIRSGQLRALQPNFQIYGRRQIFSGPVVTVKVFEDNGLIRQFLEEKGNGRVLVVDGGGSLRCAILGGNPVVQAQNNGWAGIIVNGCIRDVDEINGCDIGVRALASHPIKASKKGLGEQRVPLNIAGTRICDGEWLYADTDGICSECKGEGFVLKKLSDENAEKARLTAKNMATRYTAGLPKKWSYCTKCSSTRSCITCGGSGTISF